MLPDQGGLFRNSPGERRDELAERSAHGIVGIRGRVATIRHRHDESRGLGGAEDQMGQAKPTSEPEATVRPADRLDGHADLAHCRDRATGGSFRHTQPVGQFLGRDPGSVLQQVQRQQSPCRRSYVGKDRHRTSSSCRVLTRDASSSSTPRRSAADHGSSSRIPFTVDTPARRSAWASAVGARRAAPRWGACAHHVPSVPASSPPRLVGVAPKPASKTGRRTSGTRRCR